MSRPIIEIENLSKVYKLGAIGATSLKEEILRLWGEVRGREESRPKGEFWALKDVSFSVQPGEVVGIIGRNGAGKSTLLKILSRVTQQTSGSITLRGRVASLLEVGTGFHPDLTGRENIFLNGAILGMTRAEIRGKLDEIVAFAEVGKFIDTPVKRYSSGMYVRLAFAVAAHLEPEVLIVDEVLAVGDSDFQRKCLGKMEDVSTKHGRTVLFVSHNLSAVRTLCKRAILLGKGNLVKDGDTDVVLGCYMGDNRLANLAVFEKDPAKPTITRVAVDENALIEGDLCIDICFASPFELKPVIPGILVSNQYGVPVYGSNPRFHPEGFELRAASSGCIRMSAPKLPMHSGTYCLSVWLGDWNKDYDEKPNAVTFDFKPHKKYNHIPAFDGVGGLDWVASWANQSPMR